MALTGVLRPGHVSIRVLELEPAVKHYRDVLGLIEVARELGYELEERRISVDDVEIAHKTGNLLEAFACGTAAVISPIGTFMSRRGNWVINNNEVGPIAKHLRASLLDIQYGLAPDTRGWMHTIK